MKIYIAGPITDNPHYKEQFKAAELTLIEKGHAVINPVKNEGFTYKEYIDMGLFQLMQCDAIFMLEGWYDSKGATLEHCYATTIGIKVFYQKEANLWQRMSRS